MKKADASGARYALIVGEDEVRAGAVAVKPLRGGGQQVNVAAKDVVGAIQGPDRVGNATSGTAPRPKTT